MNNLLQAVAAVVSQWGTTAENAKKRIHVDLRAKLAVLAREYASGPASELTVVWYREPSNAAWQPLIVAGGAAEKERERLRKQLGAETFVRRYADVSTWEASAQDGRGGKEGDGG